MSLQLLLLQYVNSLDMDNTEEYEFQSGDIWLSAIGNRIVDPEEKFSKFIIRNIDNPKETEIFYSLRLRPGLVVSSGGKCVQHRNFKKIIKAVNDMRT